MQTSTKKKVVGRTADSFISAKERRKRAKEIMEQTTPETRNTGDTSNSGQEHDNTNNAIPVVNRETWHW